MHLGVNPLYAALPSYVFIMGGGAVINMSYCFIRLAAVKRLSLREDLHQPGPTLMKNAALAATGGIMWYLQFFFYAWGAANIPQQLSYVNWMLHMSIYVLCGGTGRPGAGRVDGRWQRAYSPAVGGHRHHYSRREPGGNGVEAERSEYSRRSTQYNATQKKTMPEQQLPRHVVLGCSSSSLTVSFTRLWFRAEAGCAKMPPTLTMRLPVAVTHFCCGVDQYCNWRGSTCNVTVLRFARGR